MRWLMITAKPYRDGVSRWIRLNEQIGGYKTRGNEKNRDIGYALAANSCERVSDVDTCTVAVPERFPLSQFQTPAPPRRAVGFFGSGRRASRPALRITQPTSDWPLFLKPTLSAIDTPRLVLQARLSTPVFCAPRGSTTDSRTFRRPASQGFRR
jgi:hypothetical protein